jgi:hypothetical protein
MLITFASRRKINRKNVKEIKEGEERGRGVKA